MPIEPSWMFIRLQAWSVSMRYCGRDCVKRYDAFLDCDRGDRCKRLANRADGVPVHGTLCCLVARAATTALRLAPRGDFEPRCAGKSSGDATRSTYDYVRQNSITGSTYNLPLAQIQIGAYLGLTVAHVNHVLPSLRVD
jgi:hypothetical protein